MTAIDRRLPWRVPWWLWAGAAAAALIGIHFRAPQLLHGASLVLVVGGLVLLVLVGTILWELPPAVMACGAIALTAFSGNWKLMGMPGFPFVPDRILLAGTLLALVLRSPGAATMPQVRVRGVHMLLLVLVLYATASAVLAGTVGTQLGLFGLLDRVGAVPFVMFLVAPAVFPTERERRWLLATLVGLGLYLGFVAVCQTIGPRSLLFPAYLRTLTIHAPNVTTNSGAPGPFAAVVTDGFGCYACAIAATIAFLQWRSGWRWFAGSVGVLCLFGSFLSLERGVWIGAVAGALAVGLAAREARRWVVPAAAIVAVLIVGAFLVFPSLQGSASARLNDKYPVWDRQNMANASLRMIEAKPLFGFGWASWGKTSLPYFRLAPGYPMVGFPSIGGQEALNATGAGQAAVSSPGTPVANLEVHNTYLIYATELGLIGASLWLASVFWGLGGAILAPGPADLRPWRLGLLALTVCFLVLCFVDPLEQNFTELLLWTWAGIVMAGAGTADRARVQQRPTRAEAKRPSQPDGLAKADERQHATAR